MKTKILVCILAFVMIFALGVMTACGSQGEKGDKGDTGAAGAPGAPGANGDDGADGVGIADVKIENGKLVIIYTDSNKPNTELDLPTAEESDACEHENKTLGELLNYPHHYEYVWNEETGELDEVPVNGKYVSVCNDCGYAAIVEAFEHSYVDTVVPATCTENEYSAKVCLVCFHETDVVEKEGTALGHELETNYAKLPGMNLCTEGGMAISVCANCDYNEYELLTEGIGHEVKEWKLGTNTAPTLAAAGSVSGNCEHGCQDAALRIPLPKLDKDAYDYATTVAKEYCTSGEGKATYTIYVDVTGKTSATMVEGATKFVFDVDVPRSGHYLNGVLVEGEFVTTKDGRVVWHANPLAAELVTEYVGLEATCATDDATGKPIANGQGYFECSECHEAVPVSTYKNHTYTTIDPDNVLLAAGCETDGRAKVKCTVCCGADDLVTVIIPANGHAFKYTLIENEVTGKYDVIISCEKSDVCGYVTNSLTNVDVVIKEPTCLTEGSATFTMEDGTVVKNTIAKINHVLNGTEMDPNEKYLVVDGIDEYVGYEATCTTPGKGQYTCDNCGKPQPVTTYVDHVFEGDLIVEKEPTCTEKGYYKQVKCDVCKQDIYGVGNTDDYIPALGHNYVYTYEEIQGDNPATTDVVETSYSVINGKCDRPVNEYGDNPETEDVVETDFVTGTTPCGHTDPKTPMTVVKVDVVKKPTCLETGITVYYAADGTTVTQIVPAVPHKLNGVDVNRDSVLDVTTVGVHEYVGLEATCTTPGKGYYTCDECGKMQPVETKKQHTYTDAEIIDATCEVGGTKKFTCTVCTTSYTEDIAPLGHDYAFEVTVGDTEITAKGTCTREFAVVDDPDTPVIETGKLPCNDDYSVLEVTLPALGSDEYTITHKHIASCKNEGIDEYSYTFEVDSFGVKTDYTVAFEQSVDKLEHTKGNEEIWIATEEYVAHDDDRTLPFDAEGNPLFYFEYDEETDGNVIKYVEGFEELAPEDIKYVDVSDIVWLISVELTAYYCDSCDMYIVDTQEVLDWEFVRVIVEEEGEDIEA